MRSMADGDERRALERASIIKKWLAEIADKEKELRVERHVLYEELREIQKK